MDIRFINSKNEIINASRLSIKVIGDCLIGINEKQDTVVIERYGREEEARKSLKVVGQIIYEKVGEDIVIDLRISNDKVDISKEVTEAVKKIKEKNVM